MACSGLAPVAVGFRLDGIPSPAGPWLAVRGFESIRNRMSFTTLRRVLGVELVEVSLAEKLIATAGGGLAILCLLLLSFRAVPGMGALAVVASMGASAVLLFGVPHGQLSQPWPILAGHGISAFIGVVCARWIGNPTVAAACAVGFSIGAMHQFKCIHPPGGATAFTAVMGGSAVRDLGFGFILFPVLTNALVLVVLAVILNGAFRWRRYPAFLNADNRPAHPASNPAVSPTHEEVVTAIRSLDSFVDISEEDLLRLTERLSRRVKS